MLMSGQSPVELERKNLFQEKTVLLACSPTVGREILKKSQSEADFGTPAAGTLFSLTFTHIYAYTCLLAHRHMLLVCLCEVVLNKSGTNKTILLFVNTVLFADCFINKALHKKNTVESFKVMFCNCK